jgi:FkbM family methyltransferase
MSERIAPQKHRLVHRDSARRPGELGAERADQPRDRRRSSSSAPLARTASTLRKLRPAKVRLALRRRWFEYRLERTPLRKVDGLVHLGSSYGGWTLPGGLIDSSWTCYLVGAGGDITVDLELIHRYGVTVRSIEPVADYVARAREHAGGETHFSAYQAAIAVHDGPIRMQATHDPTSQSVSAAQLYESDDFVELPGRTLPSVMAELGDEQISLLKLDIEGSEFEVLPTLDLRAMGVKVFATQLHHTGSVADAQGLIRGLDDQGYVPIACRSSAKLTFARRDLI